MSVFLDSVDPSVSIVTPTEWSVLGAGPITVTGTVTDPAPSGGIDRVVVDGVTADISGVPDWTAIIISSGTCIDPYIINAEAYDSAGNKSPSDYRRVVIDSIGPESVSIDPPLPEWTNTNWIQVTGYASDDCSEIGSVVVEGVSISSFTLDPIMGSWSATLINLNAGVNTFMIRVLDIAGNPSTTVGTIKVDTFPPDPAQVNITDPTAGVWLDTTSYLVQGNATDLQSGIETVIVNGVSAILAGGPLAFTWEATLDTLGPCNNPLTIVATATNYAGGSQSTSITVGVDTVEPEELSISSPSPDDWVTSSSVVVTGSASDYCSGLNNILVNAVLASGLTSWTADVGGLPACDNAYSITAQAQDNTGNFTSTAITVRVDRVVPTISITSPTDGSIIKASTINVTGTVDDTCSGVDRVRVELETVGEEWDYSGSGGFSVEFTGVSSGVYTVTATVYDVAGNWNSATVNFTVSIDIPTNISIAAASSEVVGSTRLTVTLLNAGGSGVTGQESLINVASNRNTITTTQDIYIEDFESCVPSTPDGCGWTHEAPITDEFLSDNHVGPSTGVGSWYAAFRAGGKMRKVIDTTGYQNITIRYNVATAGLDAPGENSTMWYSTNGGSSWNLVAGSAVTGDTTWVLKEFNLSSIDPAVENNPQFAIRFGQNANLATEYSGVDNIVLAGDPLEDTITFLSDNGDGTYTYRLNSCELAGPPDNMGASIICASWSDGINPDIETLPCAVITFNPPAVMITDPAAGAFLGSDDDSIPGGNFQYTVTALTDAPDGSTAVLTVDGTTLSAQVSGGSVSFTDTDLPEGVLTVGVEVTVKDCDDTGSDSIGLTVDITPPGVTISLPVAGSTLNKTTIQVFGTATDTNGINKVEINGEMASGGVSWVVTVGGITPLNQGSNTLTATAWDNAGNWSSTFISVFVDSIGPATPVITSPLSGPTSDNTPTVSGTAEAGSTVEVFDGIVSLGTVVANGVGNFSLTTPVLADGPHTLRATATDAAGNTSDYSAGVAITVDTIAPYAPQITSPRSGATKAKTFDVTGNAEDGSVVEVFDGVISWGTTTASGGSFTLSSPTLLDGPHTLTATATDWVG
ncbi:MAG: Ig-like domain repeat protein, partial [Deltaproteobacteria bacterium]